MLPDCRTYTDVQNVIFHSHEDVQHNSAFLSPEVTVHSYVELNHPSSLERHLIFLPRLFN